jgi:hemolysin III
MVEVDLNNEPTGIRSRLQDEGAAAANRALAADTAVHVLGLFLGMLGAAAMLMIAARSSAPAQLAAIAVYVGGMMAMLAGSAAYNIWQSFPRRELLRKLDHAAIFLMIAGTYTPITVLRVADPWGTALTIIVWTAAAAGIAVKLWQPRRVESISVVLYLALGWIGLIVLPALLESMETTTLLLLLAGGVIYSAGVIFHVRDHRRYHRALWHGCVLAAATVHYVAILTLLQA